MDRRRLERIVLLILALLNVFLLSVVLSDSAEARRSAKETAASVTAVLEDNGIAVADGAVLIADAPEKCVLTRVVSAESEKVRRIIGDNVSEDLGGNILLYRGDQGQALLRGSGETDIVLNYGAVPLRRGAERTAERLLRRIGVSARAAERAEGAETTDFYCCCEDLPVYNAVLSFSFSESCLTMVGGTRLFDSVTRSADEPGMDSVSALLRFVEIVRSEGYICSRLEGMEAGYSMTVTRSGEAELAPVWRIETDTGALLIDAVSGGVIQQ